METRICVSCGKEFTLGEEEQKRHLERQKADPTWQLPKRCKPCLAERYKQQQATLHHPASPSEDIPTYAPQRAPAFKRPLEKVRMVLATSDFYNLVQGREVSWQGVTIVLADIGFNVMRDGIDEAEHVGRARACKAS